MDGYQGREKRVIIISTVRSNHGGNLGFVEDVCRANVALTRAKDGLIVVGDGSTLQGEPNSWGIWVEWAKEHGLVLSPDTLRKQELAVSVPSAAAAGCSKGVSGVVVVEGVRGASDASDGGKKRKKEKRVKKSKMEKKVKKVKKEKKVNEKKKEKTAGKAPGKKDKRVNTVGREEEKETTLKTKKRKRDGKEEDGSGGSTPSTFNWGKSIRALFKTKGEGETIRLKYARKVVLGQYTAHTETVMGGSGGGGGGGGGGDVDRAAMKALFLAKVAKAKRVSVDGKELRLQWKG